jgi:hypothetical protein
VSVVDTSLNMNVGVWLDGEHEFVNVKGAQESVPRNRFLVSLKLFEFGLCLGVARQLHAVNMNV